VRRAGRWRRTAERRLEEIEQAGEGIDLGRWQLGEQSREPLAQRRLSRAESPAALLGQRERLAAAIVLEPGAREQSVILQRGEQLRDGGRGDRGAPGELGSDHLPVGDRLQRQVLRDRQWRSIQRLTSGAVRTSASAAWWLPS
jgi:hypothetical protein